MKVVSLNAGPKAPKDLAEKLRGLADAVDAGEICDFVGAYVRDDNYCFLFGASLKDELVMATLLHSTCIERYRA